MVLFVVLPTLSRVVTHIDYGLCSSEPKTLDRWGAFGFECSPPKYTYEVGVELVRLTGLGYATLWTALIADVPRQRGRIKIG